MWHQHEGGFLKKLEAVFDHWAFNGAGAALALWGIYLYAVAGYYGVVACMAYFFMKFTYTAIQNSRGYKVVTYTVPKSVRSITWNYKAQ